MVGQQSERKFSNMPWEGMANDVCYCSMVDLEMEIRLHIQWGNPGDREKNTVDREIKWGTKEAFRKPEITQRVGGHGLNVLLTLTWNILDSDAHGLNVHGCVIWRSSSAGCARTICDKEEGYLCRFNINNVAMAEYWAVLKCLEWAYSTKLTIGVSRRRQ